MRECLLSPPSKLTVKVVVATGMCVTSASLSCAALDGLHTLGTPYPSISHPSRNSAESFPHSTAQKV